ncbi:sensor histidine kinase [Spirosoma endbachense]|uniref:Sensor histidine kinase n=1 Tax=Spirosoma endbachense TaxID=2666025 RepID=A0A6P1VVS4_9BACT|nr:sensor histidine kinase [Spirosoma endbachense]QHV96468.1 sensor histidine kinase [Spirosoma endbachense]
MIAWLRAYSTHLLIGIALVILPLFYFVYNGLSLHPLRPHEHLVQNGLAYILFVLFSYLNHTVFVPRWFLTKQYRKYALIAVSCIVGSVYLPYRIEQWFFFKVPAENTPLAWVRQIFVEEMMLDRRSGPPFGSRSGDRRPPFNAFDRQRGPHQPDGPPHPPAGERPDDGHGPPFTLLLPVKLAIFFLLGSVSTLISISVQTASRLHQVENDQLQAELRQLKAQIQPHFLFNTLNSIYALAIRQDERTADTIVKLSEFMRYIIRDAHLDKVDLAKEINYIANYIDLQKARLRDSVQVNYQLEGDEKQLKIAPLLVFSYIENAFKYGVSPDEDSQIDIHIHIGKTSLTLYVANKKVQVNSFENSTGVGLQNTRERLRLLYPDAHELIIDNTPTDFHVHLSLTLSE